MEHEHFAESWLEKDLFLLTIFVPLGNLEQHSFFLVYHIRCFGFYYIFTETRNSCCLILAGICGSSVGGGRDFPHKKDATMESMRLWKNVSRWQKHFGHLHRLENTDPNCLWMIAVVASLKYVGLITTTAISRAKKNQFSLKLLSPEEDAWQIFLRATTTNTCIYDIFQIDHVE